MSCGPEKAWPTGTDSGSRSGSRERVHVWTSDSWTYQIKSKIGDHNYYWQWNRNYIFWPKEEFYLLYKVKWRQSKFLWNLWVYNTTIPPSYVTTLYLVFLAIHFKHGYWTFAIYLITGGVFPYTFSLQENGIHISLKNKRSQQDCYSKGKRNQGQI